MPASVILVPLLIVILSVAWNISEFQERRWLRICLGWTAILASLAAASAVGALDRYNSNAWYGHASKDLVDTVVVEMERGNTEGLLTELKRLQEQFHPTYENRARYDRLVGEFVARINGDRRVMLD